MATHPTEARMVAPRIQARAADRVLTIVRVNDHKPRTVYIDINHWYALGRADAGNPDTPEDAIVLRKLQEEVDAGRLVMPLSSVTYTELTENPRDHQRKPTADVMLKLSRLAAVARPAQGRRRGTRPGAQPQVRPPRPSRSRSRR